MFTRKGGLNYVRMPLYTRKKIHLPFSIAWDQYKRGADVSVTHKMFAQMWTLNYANSPSLTNWLPALRAKCLLLDDA